MADISKFSDLGDFCYDESEDENVFTFSNFEKKTSKSQIFATGYLKQHLFHDTRQSFCRTNMCRESVFYVSEGLFSCARQSTTILKIYKSKHRDL